MRTTKVLSLSLPPGLVKEAERIAKEEGRTKSELFREALRRYIQARKLPGLQQYEARQAQKLGIKETDVERLVEEYRIERAGIKEQLKEGAIRRADRDRQLAEEWFPLEEETWPKNKK